MNNFAPRAPSDVLFDPGHWGVIADMPPVNRSFDTRLVADAVDKIRHAAKVINKAQPETVQIEPVPQGEFLPAVYSYDPDKVLYLVCDDVYAYGQGDMHKDRKVNFLDKREFDVEAVRVWSAGCFIGRAVGKQQLERGWVTEVRVTPVLAVYEPRVHSFVAVNTSEALRRKPRFETVSMHAKVGASLGHPTNGIMERVTKISKAAVITY